MKLPSEFFRLPFRFDVGRLMDEVSALPASAWKPHPTGYAGNSSVRLISVDGAENDDVVGRMKPTAHLLASPYIQQTLSEFGVVWSRSRLMKLAAGAVVPEHCDVNYHWFRRVRIHIPIKTKPEVVFRCGSKQVHMGAGESWIFDSWRLHEVRNESNQERIHLVADTVGGAGFWRMVSELLQQPLTADSTAKRRAFDPQRRLPLLTENCEQGPVMHPGEMEILVQDMKHDLGIHSDSEQAQLLLQRFANLLDEFCNEWRQLWSLFADSMRGWREFEKLRAAMRAQLPAFAGVVFMRSNGVAAPAVMEARILSYALNMPTEKASSADAVADAAPRLPPAVPSPRQPPDTSSSVIKPLFIIAAPRSGSTLLFETLAKNAALWTTGGETHWWIESVPALKPGAEGVDSNRLTAQHCTEPMKRHLRRQFAEQLRDRSGLSPTNADAPIRFLEKTPKNSLRIPFLLELYPDARFLFLWRDPRENISSIMEAWRAGGWITYPQLPGWKGPWSLLLPPGWQGLVDRPLEEVAAYQWDCVNRVVMSDLMGLPQDRWATISYADFLKAPNDTIRKICEFADLPFDAELARTLAQPLPLSRHTHTPPKADKWRKNEFEIARALPAVEDTWRALERLTRL